MTSHAYGPIGCGTQNGLNTVNWNDIKSPQTTAARLPVTATDKRMWMLCKMSRQNFFAPIHGSCTDVAGELQSAFSCAVGHQNNLVWTYDLERRAEKWCIEREECGGFVRYDEEVGLGSDASGIQNKQHRGCPKFCKAVSDAGRNFVADGINDNNANSPVQASE